MIDLPFWVKLSHYIKHCGGFHYLVIINKKSANNICEGGASWVPN